VGLSGPKGLVRRGAKPRAQSDLAGDDIDQFAGHYDHLADGQAFGKAQHVLIDTCSCFNLFTAGAGRHVDLATQFTVNLDDQLQRVLYQGAVILHRPGGIDDGTAVA